MLYSHILGEDRQPMTSLRPDEQAANAEIERAQSRDRTLKSGLKTAASTALAVGGTSLALGGKLGSKIMPFLNEYIPADLAMKGINKVSPRLGEFLKKGISKGLNLKDGLDFIKENIGTQEKAKEQRNILEQYSPELHEFIKGHVQKGKAPLEAAALATIGEEGKKFKGVIKKLVKDHKTSWSSIIQSIFGSEGNRQESLNKFNQKIKQPGMLDQEAERFQNEYGQQQQQQEQGGQGQKALMAILQKIQQTRGGQK